MKPAPAILPPDLASARHEIDSWRAQAGGRRRIPSRFWQYAADLAQTHSVNRVSEVMRLSHAKIRARLAVAPAAADTQPSVQFVELTSRPEPAPLPAGLSLEVDDSTGRQLRVTGADAQLVLGVIEAVFGAPAS